VDYKLRVRLVYIISTSYELTSRTAHLRNSGRQAAELLVRPFTDVTVRLIHYA
jgi:hypothetical protein